MQYTIIATVDAVKFGVNGFESHPDWLTAAKERGKIDEYWLTGSFSINTQKGRAASPEGYWLLRTETNEGEQFFALSDAAFQALSTPLYEVTHCTEDGCEI